MRVFVQRLLFAFSATDPASAMRHEARNTLVETGGAVEGEGANEEEDEERDR